jgi:AcrR family transcriptional regulator
MEPAETGPRRHRPGPRAGDERRAALLDALGALLDDAPLAQIRITDITNRAGLRRSAFYFYFESKAAAVAEMLGDVYSGILTLNEWFTDHDGEPTAQLRPGFGANVSAWRGQAKMLVAMLDAVYTDEGVREVWDHWRAEHIGLISDRIRHDRDAGLTTSSTEAGTLAQLLLGALFAAMEEDVRACVGGGRPQPELDAAIAELWSRAIYG